MVRTGPMMTFNTVTVAPKRFALLVTRVGKEPTVASNVKGAHVFLAMVEVRRRLLFGIEK